jgi:phosphoribosyl 1,2-cyclic phosphate phosphodiesterase
MKGSFLFLGSGASTGVPKIGCKCPICTSSDPHNKRLRPSGLLRIGSKSILIDVGPDFRQQALTHNICDLDGLILTHTHFDHIAGLDELRVFNFKYQKTFPVLLSQDSLIDLKKRYYYMFKDRIDGESYAASLDCHLLPSDSSSADFLGLSIQHVTFEQASMKVNGYRIGSFAYISDIREFKDDIFDFLKGVECLVLSALHAEPSFVHFSIQEAADFAKKAGVKRTWLTHLSHTIDHEAVSAQLPDGVKLGFDGLEFTFQ